MKPSSLLLTPFLVALLLADTPFLLNVEGQLAPTVCVNPPSIIDSAKYSRDSNFTIAINIANVTRLNSWEVRLRYNPILLCTNKSLIAEGSFLKGSKFPPYSSSFNKYITEDYIQLGSIILSPPSAAVNGSGILARITFMVKNLGECVLDLYDIKLSDPDRNQISHITEDGYFRNVEANKIPVASFTYSPLFPAWNETEANVTFDASASPGSGGSVASYLWFFGDKTNTTVSGAFVSHLYYRTAIEPSGEWRYVVRLFVVNNQNITGNVSIKELVVRLQSLIVHDIAINSVIFSPTQALVGNKITINMTANNEGMAAETFNITVYIGLTQWVLIQTLTVNELPPLTEKTLNSLWDTTNSIPGVYSIKAETSQVLNETDTSDNELIKSITVSKWSSNLRLFLTPSPVTLGENVTIYGWISPLRSEVPVTILYREDQGSWNATLGNTFTDSNGNFTYSWKPVSAGVYEIKVSWDGDTNTFGNESEVKTVTVQEAPAAFDYILYLGVGIAAVILASVVVLFLMRFLKGRKKS